MHSSTLIALGVTKVPDHLYAVRKQDNSKIKNSMPVSTSRSLRRVVISKDQKSKLMENILLYLGNGITDHIKMYDAMLKQQATGKVALIPTNDVGDPLSIYSFRDLVLEVKRNFPGAIKDRTNKNTAIAQMFKEGFSKKELSLHFEITVESVHRILVAEGLIEKRKSPTKKQHGELA